MLIPPTSWPVFFVGVTIEGRNGIRKNEQFPVQSRQWIRDYLGASPQTPFSELHDVIAVTFPSRASADLCIAGKLNVEAARKLCKEAEAELAAMNAAAGAS